MSDRCGAMILAVVLLATARVFAAEPTTTLSQEQLIAEALEKNPEMRALRAAISAAEGGVVTARAWLNPDLAVSPGVRRIRDEGSEFHGNAELTQTFEFPGKRALRRAVAEKDVETRKLALDGFRYQLTIRVRRTFYAALASHEILALKEQQVTLAQGFAAAAQNKVQGGFAPEFEATKAEVEVVGAQRALREIQAQHKVVHAALNTLLGRGPDEPLEVTGELSDVVPSLPDSVFREAALLGNPSLKIQASEVARANLNVESISKSRLPDFTIGPNIEYVRDEQIYGLGVSLPLPLWNRKQGEIASAKGESARAVAEYDALRQEVLREVSSASQNLDAARESLSYLTPEILEKLRAALDDASQSYANGRTTLLIYLETLRTYFNTQTDYFEMLQTLFDAQAELEAAIGVSLADLQKAENAKERP